MNARTCQSCGDPVAATDRTGWRGRVLVVFRLLPVHTLSWQRRTWNVDVVVMTLTGPSFSQSSKQSLKAMLAEFGACTGSAQCDRALF
jgi:hypothetical protein